MIIINQQLENICLILIWVEELDYELLVKHNHDNSYAHSVTDVHTQKQKLEHFFFIDQRHEMYKIYRNGETTKKDTIDFLS